MSYFKAIFFSVLLGAAFTATAAPVQPHGNNSNTKSASSAATELAQSMVKTYPMTNGIITSLAPWYSWISAGMHNTLTHYGHYTEDAQYNDQTSAGIRAQSSGNFQGPNTPGNDDQLWWGLSAMSQAEFGPQNDDAQWLSMAKSVFDAVFARWQSTGSCQNHLGGIGWQIDPARPGYNYMNSITNGLAFQLAARIARYTGDQHYLDAANQIFDWSWSVGLIDNNSYSVYDGAHYPDCTAKDRTQWSYNNGVYLYGSAIMLDHTKDPKWQTHLDGLIAAMQREFAPNNILTEKCDPTGCGNSVDQTTFKAYLARWLGQTAAMFPNTQDRINPILDASAQAVATGTLPGREGAGYEMCKLEIVQAVLAKDRPLPRKGV